MMTAADRTIALAKLRQAEDFLEAATMYRRAADKIDAAAEALVEEAKALSLGTAADVPGDSLVTPTRH